MTNLAKNLKNITKNKPYAIGEIGVIPDLAAMEKEQTDWLWFMMWSGVFVLEDKFNTVEAYKKQFHADNAITLDKLPKLF